ncbi:MAG: rhodanese-like domain-containing protein [Myxococcaceae bacterium]|nr:rhodanese-like domain-containing protein [Myxococcaceae bacterium]
MSGIVQITPESLSHLPPDARRIDVREPAEFEGVLGRLPGAELVPLGALPHAAETWPREAPLLLICRSGARSMNAARQLAVRGFTRLYNLDGGMLAVREMGLSVEGPGSTSRASPAQVRDVLCEGIRALTGPLAPAACEALFAEAGAPFERPTLAGLHAVLASLQERPGAEALVRRVRDLLAVTVEEGRV